MSQKLKKIAKPKNSVLASEIASAQTDPQFYSAMEVLPNPDAVLRKLGRSQDAYDAISYDAHVMGDIEAINAAIAEKKWRILPGGSEPQDIEAYELMLKVFESKPDRGMTWGNVIWTMFQATLYGYSVHEVVWSKHDRFIIPSCVMDKPNRRFVFGHNHELRMLSKGDLLRGEVVPDMKFLLSRHLPSNKNPYGVAIFSALFWPYTFKHNGYRWFSKFMEKFGIPKFIGRYPVSATQDQIDDLTESLAMMIEDSVAAIPDGTAVDTLEAKNSGHAPHTAFIQLCNREMSKAITSQTIGSDHDGSGSRALGSVQKERQTSRGKADEIMIQYSMQELCDWTTLLNVPGAKAPIWEFYNEFQLSESIITTLEKVVKIAPVKRDEFYKLSQLTMPEPDDDVIFIGAGQSVENDNQSQFSNGGCSHHFESEIDFDELTALAAQGDLAAQNTLNQAFGVIDDLVQSADSLDELKEQLPDLFKDMDTSEFEQVLATVTLIAKAKGIDDAK